MYKYDEIDWSKLETERIVYIQTSHIKKLDKGVFVCPECYGIGRVTSVYRDPGPNKMGKCHICEGTGEIIKCIKCNRPLPNIPHMYPTKLCIIHEEERIDKLVKEHINKEKM